MAIKIEFEAVPGFPNNHVYLTNAGGSGSASNPYNATQIAGYLHEVTVNDPTGDIAGRWYLGAGNAAGDFGYRTVDDLTDGVPSPLPDFGNAVENIPKYGDTQRHEFQSGGDKFDNVIVTKV